MANHVTRGELREETSASEQRMIDALGKMVIEIDRNTTRQILASEKRIRVELGSDLAGQIVASEKRIRVELGSDLAGQIVASEERIRVELGSDLAGQIVASEERIRADLRGIDDQYRDLPKRVARLEEHAGIKRQR